MHFPNIDPIALELGPLVIRWYALAYVAGIVLGYMYLGWLDKRQAKPLLTEKARDDLMMYAVIGIILGGRLGYVLFYNFDYYLSHPAEIPHIWQGGMSFHGGMAGVIFAFWLLARRHTLQPLRLLDYLAAAAPIGLFFGRLANFINGELYGRVTQSALGVVFPNSDGLPRHPSQLYEATFEGLLLFILLFLLATRTRALQHPGLVGGVFLAGYGMARFSIEFFRQPDAQLGFVLGHFSMGQLLCVPMVLLGTYFIISARKRTVQ